MAQRKRDRDPAELEYNKLLNAGADQLAEEIEALIAEHSSLMVQAIEHRMVQEDFTFDEACANIGRAILHAHTGRQLVRVGLEVRKHLDDHTVDGGDERSEGA